MMSIRCFELKEGSLVSVINAQLDYSLAGVLYF
jgi:hypothetical protein